MKKFYEAPTSELIVVSTADIITASLGLDQIDYVKDSFDIEVGEIEI